MSSTTTIPVDKLARLVGTPRYPAVVDVRADEDFPIRGQYSSWRRGSPAFAGRKRFDIMPPSIFPWR